MLISFAVTAKLICVFVFAYVKCWFSHDAAHISSFYIQKIKLVHEAALSGFHETGLKSCGEHGGLVVESLTREPEVGGSIPTSAVLCP